MGALNFSTEDYCFMKYKSIVVQLDVVCQEYYPHLTKKVMNEKAAKHDFPFPCFRLDKSQKAPYFVHIDELAKFIEKQHEVAAKDYSTFHR